MLLPVASNSKAGVYSTHVNEHSAKSGKVNKLALTALRLAASRKESTVGESILLDATTEALL